MKKFVLGAIAALFSISSYADDTYIALELGSGSYSISGKNSENKFIQDLKDIGVINLKIGQISDENYRYYGYIQHGGHNSSELIVNGITQFKLKFVTYELGLGADYVHELNDQFYLTAGANLGVYNSDLEYTYFNTTSSSNTGLSTGLGLGLGLEVTDHFGIELGYRYTHFFSNEHKTDSYDVSFDASNIGYLNLNYTF